MSQLSIMLRLGLLVNVLSAVMINTAAASSFQQRCNAAGVVRCEGFDRWDDVKDNIHAPYGTTTKVAKVDNKVKASGVGSLLFPIKPGTNADVAGNYFANFSEDLGTQFGEGEEFFVQWRQRFSLEFINTDYRNSNGKLTNWKQIIVGEGDRKGHTAWSCTQLEMVVGNSYMRGFPEMYHSCGKKDKSYHPLYEKRDGKILLQNGAGCLYSDVKKYKKNFDKLGETCTVYRANQWMTFQMGIKIGTWYKNDKKYHRNSRVRLWVAEQGRPSKLAIDMKGYDIANNHPDAKYGKVWLLPYMSYKDHTHKHPDAATWYDELIISRQRIADPKLEKPDLVPPEQTSISSATLKGDSKVDLQWLAARDKDTGVSHYQIYRDGEIVGQADQLSFEDTGLHLGRDYEYRVAAVDGAGLVAKLSAPKRVSTPDDSQPPRLMRVVAGTNPQWLELYFNEPLGRRSAGDASNYRIDGIKVFQANLSMDRLKVMLDTSPHEVGKDYQIIVRNIADNAKQANVLGSAASSYRYLGGRLLVDFGAKAKGNRFGVHGWKTVFKDKYTDNRAYGPGGTTIVTGKQGAYNFQGVRGHERRFLTGEQVVVYWFNRSAETVTFVPKISFEDPDRPDSGESGDWYLMSKLTLKPQETARTRFVLDAESKGEYELLNINVNHSSRDTLVLDRIELYPYEAKLDIPYQEETPAKWWQVWK